MDRRDIKEDNTKETKKGKKKTLYFLSLFENEKKIKNKHNMALINKVMLIN